MNSRTVGIGSVLIVSLSGVFVVTGCSQSPPPPPKSAAVEVDPLVKAREAMDRRDYRAALDPLRNAVRQRPGELEPHYRLAVTASYLDLVEEASREFTWVVQHGDRGREEVQIARQWLASQGPVKGATSVAAASPAKEQQASNPDRAGLTGRAVDAGGPKRRHLLFLKGVPGTDVKDEYHTLRTDEQGSFQFSNVVPGDYMLTDKAAGAPTWRLRVSLAKGQRVALDLTPANQATVRDDFSEAR